jgi:hypothetical protein
MGLLPMKKPYGELDPKAPTPHICLFMPALASRVALPGRAFWLFYINSIINDFIKN